MNGVSPVTIPYRYQRQSRFAPLGELGQSRLANASALVCGCGALGSVIANTLARAGVGHLRIVDRDFLEITNLQRQVLFDEQDVADGLPKAIAAARRLSRINSEIKIEPIVADVTFANIEDLARNVELIVDGTDNFEVRFLINDFSSQFRLPWIFGGCIGAEGQTMTIVPGTTPCLRCLLPEAPPPGSTETCDTAGILGSIIGVIASIQSCEAIKILSGNLAAISRVLQVYDLWENQVRLVRLDSLAPERCPTCTRTDLPWLAGTRSTHTAVLCGRNAVQLSFPHAPSISLDELASRLEPMGKVTRNAFLMRFAIDKYQLTIFPDGRTIIAGTADIAEARAVHARYVGS